MSLSVGSLVINGTHLKITDAFVLYHFVFCCCYHFQGHRQRLLLLHIQQRERGGAELRARQLQPEEGGLRCVQPGGAVQQPEQSMHASVGLSQQRTGE